MSICNKQHFSKVWGSVIKKLSNTEAELKNALLVKKVFTLIEKNVC